jgi:hypothetical protein
VSLTSRKGLSLAAPASQPRFDPSPARAALHYDFGGGVFDAGVEDVGFHAFAGSSISQVEVGEGFTLPRRRLGRKIAKAGNPLVPLTRSRAGRGISQALRVERPVWLGGGLM